MQAVVLVGGEGTRLRPLTSRRPKPIITLVDRPFLVYLLEWLRGHGVDDVILSCGFEPTRTIGGTNDHYGITTMHERAQQIDGRVSISSAPGGGTVIEAVVPTRETPAEAA